MPSVECLELSLLSKPELCDDLFAPSLALFLLSSILAELLIVY